MPFPYYTEGLDETQVYQLYEDGLIDEEELIQLLTGASPTGTVGGGQPRRRVTTTTRFRPFGPRVVLDEEFEEAQEVAAPPPVAPPPEVPEEEASPFFYDAATVPAEQSAPQVVAAPSPLTDLFGAFDAQLAAGGLQADLAGQLRTLNADTQQRLQQLFAEG